MYIAKPCAWKGPVLLDRAFGRMAFVFRGLEAKELPLKTIYVTIDGRIVGRIDKVQRNLELLGNVKKEFLHIFMENILVPKLMLHVDPEDRYTGDGYIWYTTTVTHPDRPLPAVVGEEDE